MNIDIYEASRALSEINTNIRSEEKRTENFWCRIVVAEKESFNPKAHRHSFFELHLCLEEQGDFEIGEKKLTLSKNKYLLVPPSTEHRIISQPDKFRKFVWGFTVNDKALDRELEEKCQCGFVGEVNQEILSCLDIILRNAYHRKFGYYDIIIGQLSHIFALIVRDVSDFADKTEYRKKMSLFISEVKSYISDNLRNNPVAEDIAAQFSKSCRNLDRLCKKECALTVSGLKKQLQLERIKQLLSETEYNLDEISEMCGFSDGFTMGKFFKKLEGMPPGEYRKSYRK